MSELTVFADSDATAPTLESSEHSEIASALASVGVRFERWQASQMVSATDSHEVIAAAYKEDIDRLIAENGYKVVDVVGLTEDHPDKVEMRKKFLCRTYTLGR